MCPVFSKNIKFNNDIIQFDSKTILYYDANQFDSNIEYINKIELTKNCILIKNIIFYLYFTFNYISYDQ